MDLKISILTTDKELISISQYKKTDNATKGMSDWYQSFECALFVSKTSIKPFMLKCVLY